MFVIVVTNVVGGLITGSDVVQQRFSDIEQPEPRRATGGVLDAVIQAVNVVIDFVKLFFTVLWTFFVVLFDMMTFKIAGLPSIVGFPLGLVVSGTLVFSIVQVFRGV